MNKRTIEIRKPAASPHAFFTKMLNMIGYPMEEALHERDRIDYSFKNEIKVAFMLQACSYTDVFLVRWKFLPLSRNVPSITVN